jgi:hypothetical protein
MTHFIISVNPSKEKKVLLLLDDHSTHTKNIDALELAHEHGIVFLSLPEHTTHGLQPLNLSFSSHFVVIISMRWRNAYVLILGVV